VDGKKIYGLNKVPITSDENVNDIDLKKEQAAGQSTDVRGGQKETREQEAKQTKEKTDVKASTTSSRPRALPSPPATTI